MRKGLLFSLVLLAAVATETSFAGRRFAVIPSNAVAMFYDTTAGFTMANVVIFTTFTLTNVSAIPQRATVTLRRGAAASGWIAAPFTPVTMRSFTLASDLPKTCALTPAGSTGDSCVMTVRSDCNCYQCEIFWDNGSYTMPNVGQYAQGYVRIDALAATITVDEDRGAVVGMLTTYPYNNASAQLRVANGMIAIPLNAGRPF